MKVIIEYVEEKSVAHYFRQGMVVEGSNTRQNVWKFRKAGVFVKDGKLSQSARPIVIRGREMNWWEVEN